MPHTPPPHTLLPHNASPCDALPLLSLLEGLPDADPAPASVVSLVGAGGKTTLLYALAHALTAQGRTVITATTTHIFPPSPAQSPACLLSPPLFAVRDALRQHGHVTVTGKAVTTRSHQRKLSGLSFDALEALRSLCDFLLVEADGAAMRPLKAPAEHEPAVPPCTHVCIALCGLSGVGRPLQDYVHRPERAAALCGLPHSPAPEPGTPESGPPEPGTPEVGTPEVVAPAHLAHLALHAQGLFRTTPASAGRAVLCTLPPDMPAATGQALARQAAQAGKSLYPQHPATWWVGSALQGWVFKLHGD